MDGPDGEVHVFFCRWPLQTGFRGWKTAGEIAHAVAGKVEGPYDVRETILKPTGGEGFDSGMIANPNITKYGDRYVLAYKANRKDFQNYPTHLGEAIDFLTSDSLYGPWKPISDHAVFTGGSNPSLIQHPNGQFWLYHKVWDGKAKTARVALAISHTLEGPYYHHPINPIVVDYASVGGRTEDPVIYIEKEKFHMILVEAYLAPGKGLYLTSDDGIHWSGPMLGYQSADAYFGADGIDPQSRKPAKFERPQILMRNRRAAFLFLGLVGGEYGLSSGAVFSIKAT